MLVLPVIADLFQRFAAVELDLFVPNLGGICSMANVFNEVVVCTAASGEAP